MAYPTHLADAVTGGGLPELDIFGNVVVVACGRVDRCRWRELGRQRLAQGLRRVDLWVRFFLWFVGPFIKQAARQLVQQGLLLAGIIIRQHLFRQKIGNPRRYAALRGRP